MPQSEFNEHETSLIAESDALKAQAEAKRNEAFAARDARDRERPVAERLTFAAASYCDCGHGMAYDPLGEVRSDKDSPFKMVSQWECSAILLGTADPKLTHSQPLPFAFYEVKSETQPSANGRSSRTPIAPNPKVNPS